jgi:hypothetical protein
MHQKFVSDRPHVILRLDPLAELILPWNRSARVALGADFGLERWRQLPLQTLPILLSLYARVSLTRHIRFLCNVFVIAQHLRPRLNHAAICTGIAALVDHESG